MIILGAIEPVVLATSGNQNWKQIKYGLNLLWRKLWKSLTCQCGLYNGDKKGGGEKPQTTSQPNFKLSASF